MTERLNIRRLDVLESAQGRWRELDMLLKDKFSKLKDTVDSERPTGIAANLATEAAQLKIAFPGRSDELGMTDADRKTIIEHTIKSDPFSLPDVWPWYAHDAANIRILFPQEFIQIGIGDKHFAALKECLERCEDVSKALWICRSMKVLFPERFGSLNSYETWRQRSLEYMNKEKAPGGILERSVHTRAEMKMIWPEHFSEIPLEEVDWEIMLKYEPTEDKVQYYSDLRILAAAEITVTDKGLELARRNKNIGEQIPPVPHILEL
jgi:hypothetical protein